MKKYFSYALSLLLIGFLVSCQKDTRFPNLTADGKPSGSGGGGGKPVTVSPVYLSVTFADADGDKIVSDSKGAYVHGQENVSAYFDQYGSLQFDVSAPGRKSKSPDRRWVNFITPEGLPLATEEQKPTAHIRFVSSNAGLESFITQNMAVGEGHDIRLGGGCQDGTATDWNFSFQYNYVEGTSFAHITRMSAATWEITGADDASTARLIKSNGDLIGYWSMPFKMTLTAQ